MPWRRRARRWRARWSKTCWADRREVGEKLIARIKWWEDYTERNKEILVRINPLGSGLTLEDLAAIVRPGLDGILIPKVNGTQDIELISNYVDVLEVATGVTPGHVKLLVVATETPAAMIGFASYATPSQRLVAMTWGAEDLSAELGHQSICRLRNLRDAPLDLFQADDVG